MKNLKWLNWHLVAQALATGVQIANLAGKVAPPKYQPYVLVFVSFAQWALGTIAHYQQPPV
jgi:hypothetical protein